MTVKESRLVQELDRLANELSGCLDGRFDFTLQTEFDHDVLKRLTLLINFLLDQSRRTREHLEEENRRLATRRRTGKHRVAPPARPGARRVLIVEDNLEMQEFLGEILGGTYALGFAGDGREALDALGKVNYDLVMTDIMMPVMSGFELLRAMRESEDLAGIPVIVLTAHAGSEEICVGLELGADEFLTKPVSGKELEARVRSVLTSAELRQGLAAAARETRESLERLKLAQAELVQRERLASVGQLAGGIAHDFNNLLTVIVGNASILLDPADPSLPCQDEIQEIHAAGLKAVELTRQLVTFARGQDQEAAILDLNAVCGNTLSLLQRVIGSDVRLSFEPGPGLWPVEVNRGGIEQILMNLVINARQAMPSGGEISIRTSNHESPHDPSASLPAGGPGDRVLLEIRDTGTGIDPELLPRIFEPFFTTREVGHGSGLGLATVHGIVRRAGGTIDVESRPGAGTTFRIVFPACSAEANDGPTRGPLAILVVDDEPGVRRLTARILRRAGYHVLEAGCGAEALEIVRSGDLHLDLILTDVIMPGMSGFRLAEEVSGLRPELPCIYVSGYAREHMALPDSQVVPGPLLEKPYESRRLLDTISGCLTASGAS